MNQPPTIASLLTLLSVAFPSGGVDEKQLTLYADQLKRIDADPRDLGEAVQRLIHVREARTYPPLAEILKHLRESRSDRLKARQDGPPLLGDGRGMIRFGPLHAREMRVWRKLAVRGVTFCDVEGVWIEGRHCDHQPICHGDRVALLEAEEKLAWAEANREIDPRRAEWQGVVAGIA